MSKTSKSFWIIFLLISLVIAVVFTLISNSKQTSSKLPDEDLENLSANILNEELYAKAISLPLIDVDVGVKSHFDNLDSAKLVDVELLEELMNNTQIFSVTVDLNYKKELTISSGEQYWNAHMVYESPQTGWKIAGFGY